MCERQHIEEMMWFCFYTWRKKKNKTKISFERNRKYLSSCSMGALRKVRNTKYEMLDESKSDYVTEYHHLFCTASVYNVCILTSALRWLLWFALSCIFARFTQNDKCALNATLCYVNSTGRKFFGANVCVCAFVLQQHSDNCGKLTNCMAFIQYLVSPTMLPFTICAIQNIMICYTE